MLNFDDSSVNLAQKCIGDMSLIWLVTKMDYKIISSFCRVGMITLNTAAGMIGTELSGVVSRNIDCDCDAPSTDWDFFSLIFSSHLILHTLFPLSRGHWHTINM